MLTNTDPREILTEFGKTIGIAEIAFDEEGHCCLGFDDVVVDIAISETGSSVIVSSEITTLPPQSDETLLLRYLALNYIALIMGTGAIGVDTDKRSVRFVERISLRGLDEAIFTSEMTAIVDRVEKLKAWLAAEHVGSDAAREQENMTAFMSSI